MTAWHGDDFSMARATNDGPAIRIDMRKRFDQMNTAGLDEAMKEYDQPFSFEKGKPLSAAGKAVHLRAAKRGRPLIGKGSERINITIERGLLKQADALAKKRKIGWRERRVDRKRRPRKCAEERGRRSHHRRPFFTFIIGFAIRRPARGGRRCVCG
jgi:hypothetical protein